MDNRDIEFREEAVAWLDDNVEKGWRSRFPDMDSLAEYLHEWDARLFEGGFGAIWWPVEFGGRGATATQSAIWSEECARRAAPEGLGRLGKRLVAPILMRFGSPLQQAHLPEILSGREVWCQGFSEPDAGSDLASLRTRATLVEGGWRVNGRKIWTSFAQYADWCFLLARTGTSEARHNGISALLLDMRSPGVDVRPLKTAVGLEEFNEVVLDDVFIPAELMVGEVNGAWPITQAVLQRERGSEYSLARFQDMRLMLDQILATMRAEQHSPGGELGRLYASMLASQVSAYDLLARESADDVPHSYDSLTKLLVTETWRSLGMYEVSVLTSHELDRIGDEWVRSYFESMHYTISAGTSEIQRNAISRSLLQLPSSKH